MYEEEGKHFFHDLSDVVIEDDVLTRLTTFPTVIVTPHQGKTHTVRGERRPKEALSLGCHRAFPPSHLHDPAKRQRDSPLSSLCVHCDA